MLRVVVVVVVVVVIVPAEGDRVSRVVVVAAGDVSTEITYDEVAVSVRIRRPRLGVVDHPPPITPRVPVEVAVRSGDLNLNHNIPPHLHLHLDARVRVRRPLVMDHHCRGSRDPW